MLEPTDKFNECLLLNNFTSVLVPSSAHKRRIKNIDELLRKGIEYKLKDPRFFEISIKGIILMKAASIIGEEFQTLALKKILPLRNESNNSIL